MIYSIKACAMALCLLGVFGCARTESCGIRDEYERFAAHPNAVGFIRFAERSSELVACDSNIVKSAECEYVIRKIIKDMGEPQRTVFVVNETETCDNFSVGAFLLDILLGNRIKPGYFELSGSDPIIFSEWINDENHRIHLFRMTAENAKSMARDVEIWADGSLERRTEAETKKEKK